MSDKEELADNQGRLMEIIAGDMPATVALLGKQWAISLPSFGVREELASEYQMSRNAGGVNMHRVGAAALGICTSITAGSGLSYEACRFNVLRYGGDVYSWLRENKGADSAAIMWAGLEVLLPMPLLPRAKEVEAKAGFTELLEAVSR